jgi:hypothetical protein
MHVPKPITSPLDSSKPGELAYWLAECRCVGEAVATGCRDDLQRPDIGANRAWAFALLRSQLHTLTNVEREPEETISEGWMGKAHRKDLLIRNRLQISFRYFLYTRFLIHAHRDQDA